MKLVRFQNKPYHDFIFIKPVYNLIDGGTLGETLIILKAHDLPVEYLFEAGTLMLIADFLGDFFNEEFIIEISMIFSD